MQIAQESKMKQVFGFFLDFFNIIIIISSSSSSSNYSI